MLYNFLVTMNHELTPKVIGQTDFWNAELFLSEALDPAEVYQAVLDCHHALGTRVTATYTKADQAGSLWIGPDPFPEGRLELHRWGYNRSGQAPTSSIQECRDAAADLAGRLHTTEPREYTLPATYFQALVGWDSGEGVPATQPPMELFRTEDLRTLPGLSAQVVHMFYAAPTPEGLDTFQEGVFHVRAERSADALERVAYLADTVLRQYFLTLEAQLASAPGITPKTISYVGTAHPDYHAINQL
jgi:hypothetical protein